MFTMGDILRSKQTGGYGINLSHMIREEKPVKPAQPTPAEKAAAFKAKCAELGFTYSARDTVVSVSKRFTPGDVNAFNDVDGNAYLLLSMVPKSGGSTWGTDGIGAHVACERGVVVLNCSGVKKRFTAALNKR